ncbi:MAG: DegT/DnrJ/EryC1/StrS aminotransferase family protein [Candidatus Aminicenantes bacterium]|nr:DegT/DnrJ/EryC1/StrS aminotransferase family protein [Candidatus Aminicenantes bacterium]
MDYQTIPHSRPSLSSSDIRSVSQVLRSGQISQGSLVSAFEKKFARTFGRKYGAAVSSGTSALHLSLLALNIKAGDEVIIPSFVCTAVLNAVNAVGAQPLVVDIDLPTYNISAPAVKRALSSRTKAVIVPHMFGCPADMNELLDTGIPVIEDCAQAVGSRYREHKTGSLGILSVFSFYATKVITCGEGGMVLGDSGELISKIKDRKDYDQKDKYILRYNYKMTDIQAALGMNQLSHLDNFIHRRRKIARRFLREFKDCSLILPVQSEEKIHIYYRFVTLAPGEASPYLKKLQKMNIMCRRPVFRPLHHYLHLSGFPHTEEAWHRCISIPLYPSLDPNEIMRIIAAVKEIFSDKQ